MKKLVNNGEIVGGPFDSIVLYPAGEHPEAIKDSYIGFKGDKARGVLPVEVVGSCIIEDAQQSDFSLSEKAKQKKIDRVIELMIEKQDGAFSYGGVPINLSASSKAKINRIGSTPSAQRKVVPTLGRGATMLADSAAQQAISDAAAAYVQSIEDHAYDLIEALKAGNVPDIEAGWPE